MKDLKIEINLSLYSFFHLNLAYSSIEEAQRKEVIEFCYWPLLRLAKKFNLPFGIEATGYTLQAIAEIDSTWIDELRRLCTEGRCEFIGSGYVQMIGPLVPAEVNRRNQQIGLEVYKQLLGLRPELALVNEQAWSEGMVGHYLDAGYKAVIMEWDNPAQGRGWPSCWSQLPHYATDQHGNKIPVIWNRSVSFQKFQRFVHGEISTSDYVQFLEEQGRTNPYTFPLYGNDVEIFDFRPGRYHTEAELNKGEEWERIFDLYGDLLKNKRFTFISPRQVLDFFSCPEAGQQLRLGSSQKPVPVKKQAKYNIARWAVSGRDDIEINSTCWKLYNRLQQSPVATAEDWKELCFLWGSDFRTHITEKRWLSYKNRLTVMLEKILPVAVKEKERGISCDSPFEITEENFYLSIETPVQSIRINKRRGLTIDRWGSCLLSTDFLVGTLPHGFFENISYAADYYSGLTEFGVPGQHKVTDLNPVDVTLHETVNGVAVQGKISTPLGPLMKTLTIAAEEPEIEVSYRFLWPGCSAGSLRFGMVTMNPRHFDSKTLFYRTHNGGFQAETFFLETPVNHAASVSSLVSSSQGVGMTSGVIEIGDQCHSILVRIRGDHPGVIGQVYFQPVDDSYLCRIIFSAMEVDDTALQNQDRHSFVDREISFNWRLGFSGQI